jgi:ATPase subunit of ABC transporter with duplicated ATPase domains
MSIPAGTGEELMRSLSRTFSGKSQPSNRDAGRIRDSGEASEQDDDSAQTKVEEWKLASVVKGIPLNDQAEGRKLGVTWTGLTVKVVPSDAMLQENVLSQFNIPQQIKEGRHKPALRTILDGSSGCVKPGEMLLVLGRPGSGCTTLLKLLANKRKGYVFQSRYEALKQLTLGTDTQRSKVTCTGVS